MASLFVLVCFLFLFAFLSWPCQLLSFVLLMNPHFIFATAFLFAVSLYNVGPVFTYFPFVMHRSAAAVLVFFLHIACHCSLAAALMYLARADFSGLYLCGWLSVGSVAAFFASMSARSFPSISACPGIHTISIRMCVYSFATSSMLSRISLMIVCLDCLCGWSIALTAAWLSEYMRAIRHSQ